MLYLPKITSLKTKFTITFLGLGLIFSAVTSYLILSRIRGFAFSQFEDKVSIITQDQAQYLDQIFTESFLISKNIAIDSAIVGYFQNQPQFQDDSILQKLKFINLNFRYSAIYLLDSQGQALVSTDPAFVNQNFSSHQYFKQAMQGKPFTQPTVGNTNQKFGYYFSYPVVSSQGNPIGVVVVKLNPDLIVQVITKLVLPQDSNIIFTDEYGIVIFSTDSKKILKSLGLLNSQTKNLIKVENRYPEAKITPLSYNLIQQQLSSIKNIKIFDFFDDQDNQSEILTATKLPNFPYYYLLELSTREILAPISIFTAYLGLILIISILALTLTVSILTTRFLQPLENLQQAAYKVSNGDFSQRVIVHTSDEIGRLGESFNIMLLTIRKAYSGAELRIKRQTKEILRKQQYAENQQRAILNILEDVESEKSKAQELANNLQEKSQTLIEEKMKTDSLLESIGDGIIATNKEAKITVVNLSAQQLLGFTQSQLQGKSVSQCIHLYDKDNRQVPISKRPMNMALSSGKKISTPIGETYFYQRKDGTKFPVGVTVTPFIVQGKAIGAIEVFRDITSEKAIDKAKTEFVSLASHQLRTPLTTVSWFTEMLLSGDAGKLNPQQLEFLQAIYQGNRRMNDLVSALLNVSRIELGTFAVDPKSINFKDLIKSIIADLLPLTQERKIKIQTSYSSKLDNIYADPALLQMIFQNLLSNSIKYSSNHDVVKLAIEQRQSNFLITVSDHGVGIPASQHLLIFSKMFRADNVRQKNIEGNGLGLYIVKSIVDYSGGKIWFESSENKGTTFYITLPVTGMSSKTGIKALSSSKS